MRSGSVQTQLTDSVLDLIGQVLDDEVASWTNHGGTHFLLGGILLDGILLGGSHFQLPHKLEDIDGHV